MWSVLLIVKLVIAGYLIVLCGVLFSFFLSQLIRFIIDRRELVRIWRRPHRVLIGVLIESICWIFSVACELLELARRGRKRWVRLQHEGSSPVILVHGYLHRPGYWRHFRSRLRALGIRSIEAVDLHRAGSGIEQQAERLARDVEHILDTYRADSAVLVGASLGGVVARYYLEALGGKDKVTHLITIGSPHHGSYLAYLLPTKIGRQLQPGSELLDELNTDEGSPSAYRTLCFYSIMDNLTVPSRSATLKHAENFTIYYTGHISLLYHPRVIRHTADFILK